MKLLEASGNLRATVTAVFSRSLRNLTPDAARSFRLLGLHPGPDIDPYATAALADTILAHARAALDALVRAHLIQPIGLGRYGMHDLLRAYASSLAMHSETDDQRATLTRLFDYYIGTTAIAMDRLHPAEAATGPASRHRRPEPPTHGPRTELDRHAGVYERTALRLDVAVRGGQLRLHATPSVNSLRSPHPRHRADSADGPPVRGEGARLDPMDVVLLLLPPGGDSVPARRCPRHTDAQLSESMAVVIQPG
jgi:hypothetical protein